MKKEIWKIITEFPDYQISNYGRVMSFKRSNPTILKITAAPYCSVILCKKGTIKTHRVHRMVAKYFIKNSKNKSEVNHKDGNKLNNHYKNLEWVTPLENATHRTSVLNKRNSYLTKLDVIMVRDLSNVFSYREIALLTGVHKSAIHRIVTKKYWKYI